MSLRPEAALLARHRSGTGVGGRAVAPNDARSLQCARLRLSQRMHHPHTVATSSSPHTMVRALQVGAWSLLGHVHVPLEAPR